jgi:hypothetical protein
MNILTNYPLSKLGSALPAYPSTFELVSLCICVLTPQDLARGVELYVISLRVVSIALSRVRFYVVDVFEFRSICICLVIEVVSKLCHCRRETESKLIGDNEGTDNSILELRVKRKPARWESRSHEFVPSTVL